MGSEPTALAAESVYTYLAKHAQRAWPERVEGVGLLTQKGFFLRENPYAIALSPKCSETVTLLS
ncbi:MAG: hypothetical protein ISR58_21325 [Anaerolineales bacterium]|nr:hypothetical protein [Anaerolineales bacterium]